MTPDGSVLRAEQSGVDVTALTVVVLNDFCYVQGGASKVAIEEAISLARAGVRVIFIGAVGPPCAELRAAPLTVECLNQHELMNVGKHPGVVFQGLWNSMAARRIADVLGNLEPGRTIIHLHGYTKALTVSPVKKARKMGFPVVCTLHDFFSACPNGAFFDYRQGRPCVRRALSSSCIATNCDKRHYAHKLFRVGRGLIQRHWGEFPNAIENYITLSNRSAELLASYLPPTSRLHALENAIDWERPKRIDSSANSTVLYIGRLDQEKGVSLLADAVERLGLSATFVGDGPLRPELENRKGIHLTGWVDRNEVRRQLRMARCVVFPSLWYETYGLVVAEAAAHGIPVIASDITAAAERIENGRTGWLFRSGDLRDLVRCLDAARDDDHVARFGAAAYDRFWSQAPTSAAHTAELIAIYRSILKWPESVSGRVRE